jgi:hypothetical protein
MPHPRWDWFKSHIRNIIVYTIAIFFFGLMVITLPYFPAPIHHDLITQEVTQTIPFHLYATATFTQNNQTHTASATFDGQLVVSGEGGVSVQNPLSIYAQVTVPQQAYVFLQKVVSIHVFPLGALHYPLVLNPNGIPEVENLTLTQNGNLWTGSDNIIYTRSNETGDATVANMTIVNIFGGTTSAYSIEGHGIQVSPIDVTLAVNNNLLTASLTFAILGFAALELRKEDKNAKSDGGKEGQNVEAKPRGQNPSHTSAKG